MKTRELVRKRGRIRGLANMPELTEIKDKLLELSNFDIETAKKHDAGEIMERVTESSNPFEALMWYAPELNYLSKVM